MGALKQDRIARLLERTNPAVEDATLDEMVQRMTGAMSEAGSVGECEGLPAICRAWDVPYGKVMLWLMSDEKRYGIYKRALEIQAHALMSQTLTIADEAANTNDKGGVDAGDIAWKKLKVDTRFRIAEKHAPGLYGKADGGGNGITVVVNRGLGFGDKGSVGNPSVVADSAGNNAPLCDAISIEADGRTLTIN